MPSWRLSHSIVLLVAWLAFLIFIGLDGQPRGRISHLKRKFWHGSSMLSAPYRAPLLRCELPGKIEESYCVFLHQSCTLDDHDLAIGGQGDFNMTGKRIFEETSRHGPYYCAEGIDDATVEAIRGDIAVEMVECEVSGPTEKSVGMRLYGHNDFYEAPLGYDMYQKLVEGSYTVTLFRGFSFEGHKRVVRRRMVGKEVDFDSFAHSLLPQADCGGEYQGSELIDEATLERIRGSIQQRCGLSYRVDGIDKATLRAIQGDRAVYEVDYTRFPDGVGGEDMLEAVPVE